MLSPALAVLLVVPWAVRCAYFIFYSTDRLIFRNTITFVFFNVCFASRLFGFDYFSFLNQRLVCFACPFEFDYFVRLTFALLYMFISFYYLCVSVCVYIFEIIP